MRTTKRYLLLAAALAPPALLLAIASAGPAAADTPENWDPDPQSVDRLHAILVLGVLPLLAFVLIATAVYLPSLVRGERLAPGTPIVEDQWIGGPREGVRELAGPASVDSEAGGASARW